MPKTLASCQGKSARLIPERANFCRSAAGKILGIKRQHDAMLPFEPTELVCLAILVGSDKIRCRLSDFEFTGHALLNELNDIGAMIRRVNLPINDSDVSGFVNNECNAIRGVKPLHYAAVNFADREFSVGKQ